MANPYHDETGRFCSRGEMLGAVHKLASTGKIPEYLVLKAEFEEADKGNVTVSREVLSNLLQQSSNPSVQIPEGDEPLDSIEDYQTRLGKFNKLESYRIAYFGKTENDIEFLHRVVYGNPEKSDELIKGIASNYDLTYAEKMDFVQTYNPKALWYVARTEGENITKNPEHRGLVEQRMVELAQTDELTDREAEENNVLCSVALKYVDTSEYLAFVAKNASYRGHAYDTPSVEIIRSPYLTSDIAKTVLESELKEAQGDYRATRFYLEDRLKESGHHVPPYKGDMNTVDPLEGEPSAEDRKLQATYRKLSEMASNPIEKEKYHQQAYAFTDTYAQNYNKLEAKLENAGARRFSDPELRPYHDRQMLAATRLNNLADYKIIKGILDTDPLKD